MMLTSCEVEFGEATCARVPHHIYTHPLRRSGLLPFFSPPVIQEWLINFAGERQRSRMTSHCEIILGFCLSASHPVVELRLTGLTSTSRSIRTTCSKSLALLRSSVSVLSVRPRILWSWVRKSRGSSLSRLVRATCTKSLAANLRTVIASKRFFSHPAISSDSRTRPIVRRSFGTLRSRP